MASKPDYKVTGNSPYGVTGTYHQGIDSANISHLSGDIELMDGDGTQTSQHPAKSQAKKMRFFE